MTDNTNTLLDENLRAALADRLGGTSPRHITAAVTAVAVELGWDGFDSSEPEDQVTVNRGNVTQLTAEVTAAVKDGSLVPSAVGLSGAVPDKSRTGDEFTEALNAFERDFAEAMEAQEKEIAAGAGTDEG